MKHTAKLHHLPNGLRFPQELEGKIVFDAGQRCLIWRGFMTQDELQLLLSLATDHDYRLAVANLFEGCNRLETPFTRRLNLTLAILVALCLIGGVIVLVGVALQKSSLKHESQRQRNIPQTIEVNLSPTFTAWVG